MSQAHAAILVNTHAASQKAHDRWKIIEKLNINLISQAEIKFVNTKESLDLSKEWVLKNLNNGVKNYIALGGDGTINVLLNLLINNCPKAHVNLEEIKLGAVGIGSSNDFHKPINIKQAGFPCRIDFERAALSDIMYCSVLRPDNIKKYFLINASVGITAQANYLFNFPPSWLARLKLFNTNISILLAALHTIWNFKNININMSINNQKEESINLTNLGAIKNKHFAGFFRYDHGAELKSDDFMLHLCQDMRLHEAIKTLMNLARGRFSGCAKTRSLLAKNICLKSEDLFCVELDGEVIRGTQCEIGIYEQKIKLCL